MTRTRPTGERRNGPVEPAHHSGHIEDRIRRARASAMARAMLVLRWERLWPKLWPLATILAGALGIFLTDLLPVLPGWLHGALLVAAFGGIVWSIHHAVTGYAAPDEHDVMHRIDRDSGFRHDPLSVLDDDIDPGSSSPEARSIWTAHRARTLASIKRLRVGLPEPELARHDPIGFRALGFLVLVVGLVAGAGDAGNRIARALAPGAGSGGATDARIDVWVTPPEYTGLAPFYLTNAAGETGNGPAVVTEDRQRDVPVGSRLIAQAGIPDAEGADAALSLVIAGQTEPFETIGAGGFRVDARLGEEQGGVGETRLSVRRGDTELAGWPVRAIPDNPPRIEYLQPPSAGTGGQLRVSFRAEDDFGVATANLIISNPAFEDDAAGGEPDHINLTLPRSRARTIETTIVRATADHDWAGLPVELRLEAVDVNGARGVSEPFAMILPERTFNHPIARALVEYRKALVLPDEETIERVLRGLDDVSRYPQQYGDALGVWLGVRVVRARLAYDRDGSQIPSIREMLWLMALRLEEGEFAVAGRELMETQERVMEALRDGAFDESADALLDQLQRALDRYMDALAEELNQQGMENIGDIPGMEYFDRQDLQRMIDDARQLAETGSMDAAEQMLQQLAQMLQQLQQAMNMGQSGQEQLNAARRMLEELTDMARTQEQLLDQTFNQLRRMQGLDNNLAAGPEGDGEMQRSPDGSSGQELGQQQSGDGARRLAGPQQSLRDRLNRAMLGMSELLGSVPPSVGDAERAMNRAGEALRSGDPGAAVPSQTDALELLRQTTEGMIQMMTQQMRGPNGGPNPMQGNARRDGSDPFGRMGGSALGTQMDDGTVKVPDRSTIMRARRIYDELRRRAGERYRPRLELDYIERLLTPF